jgi:flavin-binding protein dodecin
MDESLEKALLDMEARDRQVRAELTAAGELDVSYHSTLEELHRSNASRLRQIMAVFGWPGVALVGVKGAQAAWRIALHSISEPSFMRQCRDAIERASETGDVPRWQFAIIDDRIRVYEGRPQRYGTQLRAGPNGLEPHPIENEGRVSSMRMSAGLPPLAQTLAQARQQPQPPEAERVKREAAELEFRRTAGWIQ